MNDMEREVAKTVVGARVRKDPKSGCWLWMLLSGKPCGYYGQASTYIGGKRVTMPAHRLAYEAFVEDIPDGALVRHKCDNPPCVNPEHLDVGTHADNTRDMLERGRHPNELCPCNGACPCHAKARKRELRRSKRDRAEYQREYQRRRRAAKKKEQRDD